MSENLLVDTDFTREGQFARAWRASRHTGERSFSVEVTDGTLEIRRIASQPWMLFRQTVDDARLPGATIRYTAELRGDLPSKPRLHGFDHVGGLYLKIGRDRAMLAKHKPNANQWDWRPFSYEAQVPLGVNRLKWDSYINLEGVYVGTRPFSGYSRLRLICCWPSATEAGSVRQKPLARAMRDKLIKHVLQGLKITRLNFSIEPCQSQYEWQRSSFLHPLYPSRQDPTRFHDRPMSE